MVPAAIETDQTTELKLKDPSYEVVIQGKPLDDIDWVVLDQLTTHSDFRQEFDREFNILRVTENGIHGKSGCLYVEFKPNKVFNS